MSNIAADKWSPVLLIKYLERTVTEKIQKLSYANADLAWLAISTSQIHVQS